MFTIEDKFKEVGYRPSGFDYLRVLLSISVILWHTVLVSYGEQAEAWFWTGPLRPILYFVLPAFFALSGFLVSGSLARHNLLSFVVLRIIRLFPALFMEVILSAFLLGPLVTSYSLSDYFSHPLFFNYFFNMIGHIQYFLPGVFLDNPGGAAVNVQLWTVPFELYCYVAIVLLSVVGVTKRPKLFIIFIFGVATVYFFRYSQRYGYLSIIVHRPDGHSLIIAFLTAVFIFMQREAIPFSRKYFILSVIMFSILSFFQGTQFFAAIFSAYITIYIGLLNPVRHGLIRGADYSYGLYIYGFACQQFVAHMLTNYRIWYVNFIFGLALAFVFAYISWNLIEKKVLEYREPILSFVNSHMESLGGLLSFRRNRIQGAPD